MAALLAVLCGAGCDPGPREGQAIPQHSAAGSGEAATTPGVLHVDAGDARRAGITVAEARASDWAPQLEGYGRVLDPTPFIQAVANLNAARMNAKTADAERHRVEGLHHDQENASMREVEAARATAARAGADVQLAETQLAATFGPSLSGDPELTTLTHRLARRDAALVRIDVPGGSDAPRPDRGSRLVAFPARDGALSSRFLGAAADTNPMLPGWSFLFLVSDAPPPVGTPVRARLHGSGEDLRGASIPASALLRDGERLLVFVRAAPGAYERRAVTARQRTDGTAFVSAGLRPGETVVTAGAEALLSADLLRSEAAPAALAGTPAP